MQLPFSDTPEFPSKIRKKSIQKLRNKEKPQRKKRKLSDAQNKLNKHDKHSKYGFGGGFCF
jgi:hypothetical protein